MSHDDTNHDVDGAELSPSQSLALAALLAGDQVTTAAEKGGVRRETVHRWMSGDPAFIAALRRGKVDIVDGARAELRNLATEAVGALAGVLRDPDAPPPVKIKAAVAILGMVGIDRPEPIGPCDPDDVQDDLADQEDKRYLRRLVRIAPGDDSDRAGASTLIRKALGV